MDMMFGRHAPANAVAAWGARAIYKNYPLVIDLLPDRQQVTGTGDNDTKRALVNWINAKGLPKLRQLCKQNNLRGNDSTVVTFDDGDYHLEASPQSSYGYLYIGAWTTK